MTRQEVPCPRCGQDWLERVRRVHLGKTVVLCPECDALWTEADDISFSNFSTYGEFMAMNGRDAPEEPGEIEVLELLKVGSSPSVAPGKLRCPDCRDGQVLFVRIMKRGFHFFFVCEECSASWSSIDDIGTNQVMKLSERVKPLGVTLMGIKSDYDAIDYPNVDT